MTSVKEAGHQIQNHINFLNLLYEQSVDPYYNTPKWTPECLAATKIGKMEQFAPNLQSVSELYLDEAGAVGQCPQNRYAIKSKLIYLYCENEKQLYEIKVPVTETLKLSKESLCD